jgi:cobalt-zinc-cadmium efflux system outer membrane protein
MTFYIQNRLPLFIGLIVFVGQSSFALSDSSSPKLRLEVTSTNNPKFSLIEGPLSLNQAVRYAIEHNPSLHSKQAMLRALQSETIQAGLPPNPKLKLEIENFAGSGTASGLSGSELTTEISQELELLGKRSKRAKIASLKADLVIYEIAAFKLELVNEVETAFITLLESQSLKKVSEKNLLLAEKSLEVFRTLLDSGKISTLSVNRAKLAVSEARELLYEADSAETKAASNLRSKLGGVIREVRAKGNLSTHSFNSASAGNITLSNHPLMLIEKIRIKIAETTHDLERAQRMSNMELSAGVRHSRETNENSAVAGLSIPLPLFNRNQGKIRAASERINQAKEDARITEYYLKNRLEKLKAELLSARNRCEEYNKNTISTAQLAVEDIDEAYSSGKASLLEVLDAKEVLFRIEKGRIRANADLTRTQNTLNTFFQLLPRNL